MEILKYENVHYRVQVYNYMHVYVLRYTDTSD
jgi:hypothetical protein